MAAFTLGEASALALSRVRMGTAAPKRSGGVHRTGAPVLRDSIEAGTFETLFFAEPAKGEPDRLVRIARAALDTGRRLKRAVRAEGRTLSPVERALAAMTAGAVRVYEELCTLARLNAGRVYPSYDYLAAATALGRATVARALAVLEQAGFLVRQRRFQRVAGPDDRGPGPRYEQTSNAYRPTLPQRLLAHLPRWAHPAPLPADVVQAQADRAEEQAAMLAPLSCRELARVQTGGALGRVLARLGAALDAREQAGGQAAWQDGSRESHDDLEPLPVSFRQELECPGLVGRNAWPDGLRTPQ